MLLKDKIAIVTGSTRGIGASIAAMFAQEGASVVCVGRKQDTCNEVAAALQKTYGTPCIGKQCDVSSGDDVKALIALTMETFGRVDILVNNAGITKDNLLLRMSEADFEDVIDVNLKSVFLTTKTVLRPMLKQRYGRIINIASVVGLMGNPGQANYAASKAGIVGFSKSIAKEVGAKGITINVVAPGFVQTDMIESLPKDYLDNIITSVPLKRLGKPEDIAQAVTFLASDKSSYITGQVLPVDGGINM